MSYRYEKETGDIVIEGWELGIAPSPHKGIGSMTSVDLNTELGEIMVSYSRQQQSQTNSASGTITQVNTNTVSFGGGAPPQTGSWITVAGSTISGLSNGNYYVLNSAGKLSTTYSVSSASAVTGMGSGTATWTYAFQLALPVQGATERYVDTSGVTQYRYFVIDLNGRLWVRDTFTLSGVPTPDWFLPYTASITSYNGATTCHGMAVLNGWIFIFGEFAISALSTSQLGTAPGQMIAGYMSSLLGTTNPHFAFTGHQGKLYYTDGPMVGMIFPNTSIDPDLTTPIVNVQSYCSFTTSTTTGTITGILNGTVPSQDTTQLSARIPAYFFSATGSVNATALVEGTKYYIEYDPSSGRTFQVFAAQTGGSALDITTGASGTHYFNTFYPLSNDGHDTYTFSPERLNLPSFEISTTIAELGNTIIIGTQSNLLYPWNQVDTTPGDLIPMPESNTSAMVTVNNVVYVFAGFRGNIYITNASSISLALSVPDYCTGLIEPYFIWGGAMFLRGRVWFSIQDQTASHTGQCGGVWSFVPVQNFSYGQDYGMALRMDNKSSYNSFNGRTVVFIPNQDQQARGPQYWSAWISNITSPTYGIDASSQVTGTAGVIQTDIIPTGTTLNKRTFSQIEYKLAAPLDTTSNPETGVTFAWRTNLSDAFSTSNIMNTERPDNLSGYVDVNFQNTQWLQLQITLTPNSDSTTSFVRLSEVRIR